ncbi:MAG: hypothetical protein AB9903_04075 [Vulcanimicrobiota bacterium]
MKKALLLIVTVAFLLALFSLCPVPAENMDNETAANVPALMKFHEVIYTIWHDYYPNKNFEGLKKALPDVEKLAKGVYDASLPGILRDKSKAWNEAVAALKERVKEYRDAVTLYDKEKMLTAAENLHSQFERMVRIIKPVIKELNDFHVVLYNIYHKYLPDMKMKELQEAVPQLAQKKEALMKATLPKPRNPSPRYDERVKAFEKARAELSDSVDLLVKVMETNDKEKIKEAIEAMHTKYVNTEKVFE